MSLYREPGRERRRRRLIAAAAAAALGAVVALVVLLAASGGPPSASERAAAGRDAADQILQRLDLLELEYGQAIGRGAKAAPTEFAGATGHIAAARKELATRTADLRAIDPARYATVRAALARISAAVDARVPLGRLRALDDTARAPLRVLAGRTRPAP